MKKLHKIGAFAVSCMLSSALVLAFAGCDSNPDPDPKPKGDEAHVHAWTVTKTTAQTCGEAARTYYSCDCGATKTERGTAATGEHKFENHVCTDCGYIDMSEMDEEDAIAEYGYYHVDADESGTYTTNDKVYFGSYPQALVGSFVGDEEDENAIPEFVTTNEQKALIDALNAKCGELPTDEDEGDWTSYNYYDGGKVASYMYYQDVEHEGEKYRGVYLESYRPTDSTYSAAGADKSYTDEQGYELETIYWFKYSALEWVVLDCIEGELLLNCNYCVEAQTFNDTCAVNSNNEYVHSDDSSVYVSDWEHSSLRTFLNNTFIELAFSEEEAALIGETKLDNSTTGYTIESPYQPMQKDTTDNVFLLSYQDMLNTDYGFPATVDYDDTIDRGGTNPDDASVSESLPRRRAFTAYALIQGMRPSSVAHTAEGNPTCWYTLRSSGDRSYSISGITKYGSVQYKGASGNPAYSVNAIVPSLYLKINNTSEA